MPPKPGTRGPAREFPRKIFNAAPFGRQRAGEANERAIGVGPAMSTGF